MDTSNSEFLDRLVKTAQGQVGNLEVGNNRGAAVHAYQTATSLDPGSWAWCAAFVCWCFQVASIGLRPGFPMPSTAVAFEFEAWGKRYGKLIQEPDRVMRGDIVIFEFSHVGIASGDSNGKTVPTIEGNTHPDDGEKIEGVFAKVRPLSQVRSIVRL